MARSRYSYKQILYLVAVLAFAAFLVTYCTQKVVDPFVGKYTTPSEGFIFQKAQEERINKQLERILKRLFGKDGYYVSVRAALRDNEESVEAFELVPELVTKNAENAISQNFNRQGRSQKQDAASSEEEFLQEGELVGSGVLPGLIQPQNVEPAVNRSLPGFPLLEQRLPTVKKTSDNRIAFQGQDDYQGRADDSSESEYTHSETSQEVELLVSKRNTKTLTPLTSINRLMVSVVIDEKRYEREPVDLEELKTLISSVAGLDSQRGDEVKISVLPITHKLIDWYEMGKTFQQVKKTLAKYKKYFYGFTALLLLGGVIWLLRQLYFYQKARREARLKREAESKRREELTKEQEAEGVFNNKRDEILRLTKDNPRDVAQLILNWVEKTTDSEDANE